jgi:hypothetical protein
LMDAGYWVHLANPAAIQQYSGLRGRGILLKSPLVAD